MITTENINKAYTKHNNLAANGADIVTDRNMHDLMMFAIDSDFVDFDGDRLILVKGEGPLAEIEIDRIAGAEDFGSHMAIILANSAILVNKRNGQVRLYLPDAE